MDENGHTSFAKYRRQDGVLTVLWVERRRSCGAPARRAG